MASGSEESVTAPSWPFSWRVASGGTRSPHSRSITCNNARSTGLLLTWLGRAATFETTPMPDWVHKLLNDWRAAAGIQAGKLFRKLSSAGKPWGDGVTEKLVWHVVKEFVPRIGNDRIAPHDLRRTCARLCRAAGGELELPPWPYIGANDGTISRLHTTNCRRRERQDRNRTGIGSSPDLWKGGRPYVRRWLRVCRAVR